MRLLLIEDDIHLGDALTEALTDQGYIVDWVKDGVAGWEQSQLLTYDLLILDVMLPKLDGITLCQKLRHSKIGVPILMLTALDTSLDKVKGLDSGADDYMIKPVDLPELLARLRALLRRSSQQLSAVLTWGELSFDPTTYELSYGGEPIRLTPKELSILEVFLHNGRRVLTRSHLIERCWSFEDPPDEETIKSHLKSMRHKLRKAGAPEDFIETVYGIGYRLKQI
ncbi:MAG TPA: response regulator transcription factor [Stenomitos sp.]